MVSSGSHCPHCPRRVVWHFSSQPESRWPMHFQPAHFQFGQQNDAFYSGQFVIWPLVWLSAFWRLRHLWKLSILKVPRPEKCNLCISNKGLFLDVIYQAWDAVFHHQKIHHEESRKYDTLWSIFDKPRDISSNNDNNKDRLFNLFAA